MPDVRLDRTSAIPPVAVPGASEERRHQGDAGSGDRRDDDGHSRGRPRGHEDLAVALGEAGRSLRAELEQGPGGELLVRVVDRNRGELVAVLTPDELRALAEQVGLPAGLLFQARS